MKLRERIARPRTKGALIALAALAASTGCCIQASSLEGNALMRAEVKFEYVCAAQAELQSPGPAEIPAALDEVARSNPNACAWLYVPNTLVSLPVLRHPQDDTFYLVHGADDAYTPFGSAMMQAANSADFSDSATVVYGHTLTDSPLGFSQLALFQDSAFFEANRSFYLFREGGWEEYEIASARLFGTSSILSAVIPGDPGSMQRVFDFACEPGDPALGNWADVERPDASRDSIVMLSTCPAGEVGDHRLVVTGIRKGGAAEAPS